MSAGSPGRRMAGAMVLALIGLGSGLAVAGEDPRSDHRPNVIVVLTDDQRAGTFTAMPWLSAQLARPASGWTDFQNAFANTPLCCPARASLLTGRHARHTGVLDNGDGGELDESATIATWLHDAGYRTGLVGKYLNGYPFGRLPYVPRGWDRFFAKDNHSADTVYRDFPAVDQGSPVSVRGYATDRLAAEAVRFVGTAPPSQPFFLLFAPSAPHPPWAPADRHAGAYADLAVEEPPNVSAALRGAPPWVRSLPPPSAAQRTGWLEDQRQANETLLAVDEALRSLVRALGPRLHDTAIFVLSDNGYSFGEHRWVGKKCPYEACVRIPFAVHSPWSSGEPPEVPVSMVDLAPTILDLAGVRATAAIDGSSFAAAIRGGPDATPRKTRGAVFLEWAGDPEIPAWTAIRTVDLKLIRYADGVEELYDLGGTVGRADPWELRNRAADPRYAGVLERLRALSERLARPG